MTAATAVSVFDSSARANRYRGNYKKWLEFQGGGKTGSKKNAQAVADGLKSTDMIQGDSFDRDPAKFDEWLRLDVNVKKFSPDGHKPAAPAPQPARPQKPVRPPVKPVKHKPVDNTPAMTQRPPQSANKNISIRAAAGQNAFVILGNCLGKQQGANLGITINGKKVDPSKVSWDQRSIGVTLPGANRLKVGDSIVVKITAKEWGASHTITVPAPPRPVPATTPGSAPSGTQPAGNTDLQLRRWFGKLDIPSITRIPDLSAPVRADKTFVLDKVVTKEGYAVFAVRFSSYEKFLRGAARIIVWNNLRTLNHLTKLQLDKNKVTQEDDLNNDGKVDIGIMCSSLRT